MKPLSVFRFIFLIINENFDTVTKVDFFLDLSIIIIAVRKGRHFVLIIQQFKFVLINANF
jgi:hypothetical protein